MHTQVMVTVFGSDTALGLPAELSSLHPCAEGTGLLEAFVRQPETPFEATYLSRPPSATCSASSGFGTPSTTGLGWSRTLPDQRYSTLCDVAVPIVQDRSARYSEGVVPKAPLKHREKCDWFEKPHCKAISANATLRLRRSDSALLRRNRRWHSPIVSPYAFRNALARCTGCLPTESANASWVKPDSG